MTKPLFAKVNRDKASVWVDGWFHDAHVAWEKAVL
jgi:hypothetical protein